MSTRGAPALRSLASPDLVIARCILFPCAGCGPGSYSGLKNAVPREWAFDAFCAPGRENRCGEPFASSVEDLASEAVHWVRELSTDADVPLVLVGHSLGALVAWLVAAQVPTDTLVVAAAAPPDIGGPRFNSDSSESVEEYLARLLEARGVLDIELREELVMLCAPILAADVELLDRFSPVDRGLSCDVRAIYGHQAPVDALAWSGQTSARATSITLPGSHFFIWEDPAAFINALRTHVGCLANLRVVAPLSDTRPDLGSSEDDAL